MSEQSQRLRLLCAGDRCPRHWTGITISHPNIHPSLNSSAVPYPWGQTVLSQNQPRPENESKAEGNIHLLTHRREILACLAWRAQTSPGHSAALRSVPGEPGRGPESAPWLRPEARSRSGGEQCSHSQPACGPGCLLAKPGRSWCAADLLIGNE